MANDRPTPDKRDSPSVAEVRAHMRDTFFRALDSPNGQDALRRAANDPKMVKRYPGLFAAIRKFRPHLLPDEAKP